MASLPCIVAWFSVIVLLIASGTADREDLAPFLGIRYKMDHCENLKKGVRDMQFGKSTHFIATPMELTWSRLSKDRVSAFTLTEDRGVYTLTKEICRPGVMNIPFCYVTRTLKFRTGHMFQDNTEVIFQKGSSLTHIRLRGVFNNVNSTFSASQLTCRTEFVGIAVTCVFKPDRKGENDV